MNIFFVIPGMAFDGETPKIASLGGSETAAVCMARELAKRGHSLTVMANLPGEEREIDGVTYVNIARAEEIIQKIPHDILVVQRSPQWLGFNTASKINVLWNHDLALKNYAEVMQGAMWNCDWVFLLSQFHVKQFRSVYGFWPERHIKQSRNGIDLEDFHHFQKIPGKVMYGARPERGLENLVKPGGIMEQIYAWDKSIHLYVVGYDNMTQHMAPLYKALWQRCEDLPNVTNLGHLTKKDLYRHYAEAQAYLYPTEFEEISCITAMECMACGTPFITTPLAALPETLGENTAVWVEGHAATIQYQEKYVGEVLKLLHDKPRLKELRKNCRERAKAFSWSGVAEQWENLFLEYFKEATKDKRKLARHFLYMDDVIAAGKIATENDFNDILSEIDKKAGWAFDKESHERYYDEFGAKEWEGRKESHVADHFDNVFVAEPRWYATQAVLKELNIGVKTKILDVGCCCGWFSVGMANFGHSHVVGIDPCRRYIEEAKRLSDMRLKRGKTEFYHTDETGWQEYKYDVIYIAEVLEHLAYIEPVDFVKRYEAYLKPGGWIVITTPFGPLKRTAPKRSDAHHDLHVRHLEMADIEDLFGKKLNFSSEVVYWMHTNTTRELCGWYLYRFQQGWEYGEIDYNRKFKIQMPRESLTTCMIVKNEEANLRRCLKSVDEISDEIIIVDTGSTDRTKEIAREFTDLVFDGSDPLVKGFETARNESISRATGDWILWIDADEELQGGEHLRKYLKPHGFEGFRIRQHHFTCVPVGMVQPPDKPVRLFRRNPNVRFWGLIHEHPGVNPNDSVGEVIELADVDIAHAGYYTEDIRRKRFWRNLPMMAADIEKYPERWLGKFLYMRDVYQLVIWSIEQTGRITEDAQAKCSEIIQLYRNNFLPLGGHMMHDGLNFYSKALEFTGRGQEFYWSVNMGNGHVQPDKPRKARFADKEDFKMFMAKVLEERSWLFEGKYRV